MFCRKCGKDMGQSKYCPSCGAEAAPATDSRRKYSGKTVNKIAYALIAIFVGDFGIHRFYAGRTLSGILYLLFFWTAIPGIIGFVEGILALLREDDDYGNIPVIPGKYLV